MTTATYHDSACANSVSIEQLTLGTHTVISSTDGGGAAYDVVFSCTKGRSLPMLPKQQEYAAYMERASSCTGTITYMDFTLRNYCYTFSSSAVNSLPYIYEYPNDACSEPDSVLQVDSGCSDVGSGSGKSYEWKIVRGSQDELVHCGELPSLLT